MSGFRGDERSRAQPTIPPPLGASAAAGTRSRKGDAGRSGERGCAVFPEVDRSELAKFVTALFLYAHTGFIQLRAFRDDANGAWRPDAWPAIKVEEGIEGIVEAAERFARECAAADVSVVFAPPIATFNDATKGAEKDVALGITLSVELDQRPREARDKLVGILGPPTIGMASGGEWTDPVTGEIQSKQHLHWRLVKPACAFAELVALKEARRLAMALIGGDPSGVPLVHPMRWAGTWHRKGEPKLATITEWNDGIELELADTLEKLKAAKGNGFDREGCASGAAGGCDDGTRDETAQLIAAILRAEDYHRPLAQLAMRCLMGGMADAQAVEVLRGIMLAVDPGRRDYKNGTLYKDRWRSRYDDIPRAVSTARAKIVEEPGAAPAAPWPEPAAILNDEWEPAPVFPIEFLPGPLGEFACDITDRMQCPVDIVAIPLIIGAATVIGKDFRLAPKAFDDWTERPCLWGGVILPSGQMKTPGLQNGMRPIRLLESDLYRQHEKEIEDFKEKMTRAQYAEQCWKQACKAAAKAGKKEMPAQPELPPPPRLPRLTTTDVTQEALVDLIEQNPRGLMLFRDELSGWFASFNQYRPGGDRQFYLECHAGGSFLKDRRLGSALVKDLYLNMCGGLQPDVVRTVLAGGDRDGMAARFSLLVCPDPFDEFTYIDREPNSSAAHKVELVFKKLLALDPEAFFGPDKPGWPRAMRFDDDAQTIFFEWYTTNQRRIRKGGAPDAFIAHVSKYAGLFARLSIVHHLVRYVLAEARTPLLVDAVTASAVEAFIDWYLEPHARRVYRRLGTDPVRAGARRIARWIASVPTLTKFTARDIRRKDWSELTSQDDVNAALDHLENVAGWIRCTVNLPGPKGGRPSTPYLVNPLVRRVMPQMTRQTGGVEAECGGNTR